MIRISYKIVAYTLCFAFAIVFFSCKRTSDTPGTVSASQPDNIYAYSLITETNGWHILRKDSIDDSKHIAAIIANPDNIFFANNSIYYSVACQDYTLGSDDDIRLRKCNLDGSNSQQIRFPNLFNNNNSSAIIRSFAFNDATTTYSFNRVSLYQQLFNADGTIGAAASERMGFAYFTGKSGMDYGFSFSPAAKCFAGFLGGYTVADVTKMTMREFIQPNDRSEMSYAIGTSAFDEEYSVSNNSNHYRIFYASKGVTTYTDNHQFDVSIHCISDTASRNYGYNGHSYYFATTVDTIHLSGNEKYPLNLELTTDNQNLYLVVIKGNKALGPTAFSADLIIYDKNTFKRIKYFASISIPAIQTVIDASKAPGIFNLAAVSSKNYVALLVGSKLRQRIIKFDINTGTASDITPVQYQSGITSKCVGSSVFSNGTRIYTMVVRATDTVSLAKCSNIIYYE